MKSSILYSST